MKQLFSVFVILFVSFFTTFSSYTTRDTEVLECSRVPFPYNPSGVKHIAASPNGTWAIANDNTIHLLKDDGTWMIVYGGLQNINVSPFGNDIYVIGINKFSHIWQRHGVTPQLPQGSSWSKIEGGLRSLSLRNDGKFWGVNPSDIVYFHDGTRWIQHPERNMLEVTVDKSNEVYGLTRNGDLYRRQDYVGSWDLVKSQLEARGIRICNDVIWGVGNTGALSRINTSQDPQHITSFSFTTKGVSGAPSTVISQVSCNQAEEFPWFVSGGVIYNQCTVVPQPTVSPTLPPTTTAPTPSPTTTPTASSPISLPVVKPVTPKNPPSYKAVKPVHPQIPPSYKAVKPVHPILPPSYKAVKPVHPQIPPSYKAVKPVHPPPSKLVYPRP